MSESLKTALEADPTNPFLQGHVEALDRRERTATGPSDETDCSVVRWISVADKLPDDEMTVLIADTENDVTIGFHDGHSGWRYCSAGLVVDPVTHWAEIPDPPNDSSAFPES